MALSYTDFLNEEQSLTPAALTVRIQSRPYNDQGTLVWDLFFPRQDVPSVKINQITTLDFRPVSDRREWNARGRIVQPVTPKLNQLEMIPIESRNTLGERELQELTERTFGNMDIFRQIAGVDIPNRIQALSAANQRRIELDAIQAWTSGNITVTNPETGVAHTVSYGIDSTRYLTAGTAWNDMSQNAYNNLLTWIYNAMVKVGPISGIALRRATLEAIRAKAPAPIGFNSGVTSGISELTQRIAAELGIPNLQWYVMENTVDKYNGATLQTTRTNVWPTGVIAAVPVGVAIGDMAFAPVVRAVEQLRANPDSGIDVNGSVAWLEARNGGREMSLEVQTNAFPVPNEQKIYVENVGV